MIIGILLIQKKQKIKIDYFLFLLSRILYNIKNQQMRRKEMSQKSQEIEKYLNNESVYEEIQEKQQEQVLSIKEKLFCYLNQLLKKFRFFSTHEIYLEDILSFNKNKENHPTFLNFITFDWDIQNDKQQFSTLLYFKVIKQIEKVPGPRARNLKNKIHMYYFQMLQSKKLHFLQFYHQIANTLFEQLGRLLNSQGLTNIQCQLDPRKKEDERISWIEQLYEDIMEIDQTYALYNSEICRRNSTEKIENGFEFLEIAFGRNEKIIQKVIKFSSKIRKYSIIQKYRSMTAPKETKPSFKIRRSQSSKKENINNNQIKKVSFNVKTNQQRDEIPAPDKSQLKGTKLYLRPIHNFKKKIRLRLF